MFKFQNILEVYLSAATAPLLCPNPSIKSESRVVSPFSSGEPPKPTVWSH